MFRKSDKTKPYFCKISGIGHSEPSDSELFQIITQEEFINMLPQEAVNEITRYGEISIQEIASTWSEMISEKRTFFKGSLEQLGNFAVNRLVNNISNISKEELFSDLDAIIGATNTGPIYPSLADFIKNEIGVRNSAMCFDVTEACTSGSVALFQAYCMIKSGSCRKVLVVASEKATKLTDISNWRGSNLFGDASFAVLLERAETPDEDSFDFFYFNSFPFDGNLHLIQRTEDGFVQDGKKVHLFVVKTVVDEIFENLKLANIEPSEIKHMVFHQPSRKTTSSLEEYLRSRLPNLTGTFHYSDSVGNASSASFGNLMSKLYYDGVIKKGEYILTCTFGAGLSVAIIGLRL